MTTIHTHTTGEAGFAVNSYLVETPEAVLAVDAPFLLSDARSFRALPMRSASHWPAS